MASVTQLYLEKCRTKLTVEIESKKPATDYQLAKFFGISTSAMTNYTKHERECDEELAYKMAQFLNIPPMEVIGAVNAQKAKSSELKSFWENAKRGSVAAISTVALSGVLMAGSDPAKAGTQISHNDKNNGSFYTLCEHIAKTEEGVKSASALPNWRFN